MAFDVIPDHRIVPHGRDIMHLYDSVGTLLVTATRTDTGWNITSPSTDDEPAADRAESIRLMTEHALEHVGPSDDEGRGYVTQWPHGLDEMP